MYLTPKLSGEAMHLMGYLNWQFAQVAELPVHGRITNLPIFQRQKLPIFPRLKREGARGTVDKRHGRL